MLHMFIYMITCIISHEYVFTIITDMINDHVNILMWSNPFIIIKFKCISNSIFNASISSKFFITVMSDLIREITN
jgi:hypothetical protein